MMDLPWLNGKVHWNRSTSRDRKRWAGGRIGWFGADRDKKTKSSAIWSLKSMELKSSHTAASLSQQRQTQERRRIRKYAKGSQCARKRVGDRATSNVQWVKSMLRVGFTLIATWQTRKKQLLRKQWGYQEEKMNVKCDWKGENAIAGCTEIGMCRGYGF